jgi:hypothetical protein
MSKNIFGLKEKIANAINEQEIVSLLKIGQTYKFASPRTQKSWKNAGYRSLERHKTVVEVEVESEVKSDNTKETKFKNKKVKK